MSRRRPAESHPVRIVLVETTHPGNIGAAARAVLNMGADELVLVRPACYPSAEATVRASAAASLLERSPVVTTIAEAIDGCGFVLGSSARPRAANWNVLDPRQAALRLVAETATRPAAVLFGGERSGLCNEDLSACHALLNIPANPAYESLNLAQAIQIVTWELRMARGASPRRLPAEAPLATAAQMRHLRAHVARVLPRLGYSEARSVNSLVSRIERLLARAVPDEKEVQILRGVLTEVERVLERAGDTLP